MPSKESGTRNLDPEQLRQIGPDFPSVGVRDGTIERAHGRERADVCHRADSAVRGFFLEVGQQRTTLRDLANAVHEVAPIAPVAEQILRDRLVELRPAEASVASIGPEPLPPVRVVAKASDVLRSAPERESKQLVRSPISSGIHTPDRLLVRVEVPTRAGDLPERSSRRAPACRRSRSR